jgi:peptide/nickel transport system substrate-binding protein
MALISGLVAVVFVVQVIGMAGTLAPPARAAGPVNLRIGFLEAIDHLNVFTGLNDPSFQLYGMMYDYLFSIDQDGNLVANLAVAASADSTGANWTYQIRQNVNWSDGTPMTAEDVNFTINYNIADFNTLFNYEPYLNHVVQCANATEPYCGAKITSPWNVTIYFDGPFVAGKAIFVPIIQKAQWENIPLADAQSEEVNCPPYPDAKPPIGTGPFIADPNICTEKQNHQPLEVHKNPSYHPVGTHVGPSPIDTIYMQQFADENQMVGALERGDIDVAKFTSSGYDALSGQANIQRQQGLICTQYWNEIGISQYDNASLNPARYDENVRRAMARATNKDYILNTIYNGRGVRGADLMTPITPEWFFDPTQYPAADLSYNLTAANALLDQAGYTDRAQDGTRMAAHDITVTMANGTPVIVPAGTRLEFTMDVRQEFVEEQSTANYLTAQWAAIGIKLDVTIKLETALSTDVYGGAVDTYIWFWSGDPDPNYLLSIQSNYTLDGWNDNFWDNTSYNDLYVKQLADFDSAQRQQDVLAAQSLHYNSSVYIIYIYPYGEWAWRTDGFTGWGNWTSHPYRQIDNFWGANPLFFDLTPLPPANPGIPVTVLALIGIVVVAVVAAAVYFVLRSRKQKQKEAETKIELPKK